MASLDDLRRLAARLEDEFLDELCRFPFDSEASDVKAAAVKAADAAVYDAELGVRFAMLRASRRLRALLPSPCSAGRHVSQQ